MVDTIEALLFAMGVEAKLKIVKEKPMENDPAIKQIGRCSDGMVGFDGQTGEYVLQTKDAGITYRVYWPENRHSNRKGV